MTMFETSSLTGIGPSQTLHSGQPQTVSIAIIKEARTARELKD